MFYVTTLQLQSVAPNRPHFSCSCRARMSADLFCICHIILTLPVIGHFTFASLLISQMKQML